MVEDRKIHTGRPHRGPGGPGMPAEKAKNFKGTVKKLLAYMGKYKTALIGVMIFAVAGTAFNIIGPKILSRATTELFNGLLEKVAGTGGINFDKPFALAYSGLSDHLLTKYIEDSTELWAGKTESLPIKTVGCTIGTHAGPGAIVLAFFEK